MPPQAHRQFGEHAGVPQQPGIGGGDRQVGGLPAVGAGDLAGELGGVVHSVDLAAPAGGAGRQQPQQQGQHQGRRGHHGGAPPAPPGGEQGEPGRAAPGGGGAPFGHPDRGPAPLGGGLFPGLAQEEQAQRQGQHEHRQPRRHGGPPGKLPRSRSLFCHADGRLAVPLVHSVQVLGGGQGRLENAPQGQPPDHRSHQGSRPGHNRRAGQQPQPDLARRGAQGHQDGHRLPLTAHEQVAEQEQHHQHTGGAGGGHRHGGGLHGLERLGGGGIALVVQGDPHPVGDHGLDGVGGLAAPCVVQHRPAQLVAEQGLAEAPLGGGHPETAGIVLQGVGDAHHLQSAGVLPGGQVKAVVPGGGQHAQLHRVLQLQAQLGGGEPVDDAHTRLPRLGEAALLQEQSPLLEALQGGDVVAGLQPDIVVDQLVVVGVIHEDAVRQGGIVRPGQLQVGRRIAPLVEVCDSKGGVGRGALHKGAVEQVAPAALRDESGVSRLKDRQNVVPAVLGVQRLGDGAAVDNVIDQVLAVPRGIAHITLGVPPQVRSIVLSLIGGRAPGGEVQHIAYLGQVLLRHESIAPDTILVYLERVISRSAYAPVHTVFIVRYLGLEFAVRTIEGDQFPILDRLAGQVGLGDERLGGCHRRQAGGHHHGVVLVGDGAQIPLVAGQSGQGLVALLPQLHAVDGGDSGPVQGLGGLAGVLVRRVPLRVVLPHVLHQGHRGIALVHGGQRLGAVGPHPQPQGQGHCKQ